MHFERAKSAILILLFTWTSNAFATPDCNQILRAYSHYEINPSTTELRRLSAKANPWWRKFWNPIERIPTATVTSNFRSLSESDQIRLRNYFAQLDHLKVEKSETDDPLNLHDLKELIQTASRLLEAEKVPHRIVHLDLQDAIVIEPDAEGSLLNQLAADAASDGYKIGFSPIPHFHAYFNSEIKLLSLPIESIFSPSTQNMDLAHEWVHLEMHRLIQKGTPAPLSGQTLAYEGGRLPVYGSYFPTQHGTYFSHEEITADLAGLAQVAHDIRAIGFDSPVSNQLLNLMVTTTRNNYDQSVWLEIHTQEIAAESKNRARLRTLTIDGVTYLEYRGKHTIDQFPVTLSSQSKYADEFQHFLAETLDSARKGKEAIKQFMEENRDLYEQTTLGKNLILRILPIIRP